MTTTYFVEYIVKTERGPRRLEIPCYTDEADARAHYEFEIAKPNVLEARLVQRDHYDQEELMPRAAWTYPYGKDYNRILSNYTRI